MARRVLLLVEPTPRQGERAVLKPDQNPALVGKGSLDLVCGKCKSVLARGVWPGLVYDLGILCSECGAFNDTPSAAGSTVTGNVVFFPAKTYRLTAPVDLSNKVPLVGELFPGAGPPAVGNITPYSN